MPQTLYGGQVGSELLRAGLVCTVTVTVGSGAIVQRLYSDEEVEKVGVTTSASFGPYASDMVLRVSAYPGATVAVALPSTLPNSDPVPASGLSSAEVAATRALVSGAGNLTGVVYDGSSRVTNYTLNGVAYVVAYPNATTITVTGNGRVVTITLDGSGRVTGKTVA